ncbi:MAG TPA: 2-dehydropantoate 2-reductase [Candidatus Binatia bacterium]|nr:2-dehydropantoate 2-reductase [Candidatus Binatia bacterium]
MKVLVVGAGAVGGYFGAKLARAGHELVFTARGDNLRALVERGLAVESFEGDFVLARIRAVESASGQGPFSLVIVCVKAHDTERAVGALGSELEPQALVISLQNGVESEPAIERLLDIPPMIRAIAYVGAELVAPGVVRHVSGGTIVIGEPDDSHSQRLERLERVLRDAAIDVVIPPSIQRAKWQKLAWNASFNLISALSGATIGGTLVDPDARRLAEAAMREVESVANAQGIEFDPDHVRRMLLHAERNLGFVRPSTLQDREKRKPLEHDALSGAVVRFGRRYGVPTPIHQTLDSLARLLSAQSAASSPPSL